MSGAPPTWRWGDSMEPLRGLLARGGVLAIPSESSYGLGCDPRSERGMTAIYALKGREAAKPLPLVAADRGQLEALGVRFEPPEMERLARAWPAALTLVLPLRYPVPAAAGGATLAVRVPAHDRLRELLRALGPMTATSANRSGEPPVLEPTGLAGLLAGADAVIVDDGRLPGGPASTVVAWGPGGMEVLRRGAYPIERLAAYLWGMAVAVAGEDGAAPARPEVENFGSHRC